MRDVSGPRRRRRRRSAATSPLHDLTGGNHFVPDILPDFFPDEVDVGPAPGRQAARHRHALSWRPRLELTRGDVAARSAVAVTVTNETGHKLPSGLSGGPAHLAERAGLRRRLARSSTSRAPTTRPPAS